MRRLSLLVGSTAVSIGICLAAFMAGLGLGSWFWGNTADRTIRRGRLFAALEMGIGLFGAASLPVFQGYAALLDRIHASTGSTAAGLIIECGGIFLALLVPTFLMGGTFPVAVRYLSDASPGLGRPIGFFYGINTTGAAATAFLAPTVILPVFGVSGATYLAVGLNLMAGSCAFFLPDANRSNRDTQKLPDGDATRSRAAGTCRCPGASPYYTGAALFLSGLAALGLETLYNRVLVLTFGGSLYSFSFILGVYLLGIGLGGQLFAVIERGRDSRQIFFLAQFLVFCHVALTCPWIDQIPAIQLRVFDRIDGQFWAFQAANVLVTAMLAGPVALGFGVGYPAAIKSLSGDRDRVGHITGMWAAVSGAGSALGSLIVTFVFLPGAGSFGTFIFIIAVLGLSLFLISLALTQAVPARKTQHAWMDAVRPLGPAAVAALMGVTILLMVVRPRWDMRPFHAQIGSLPDWALRSWRQKEFPAIIDALRVKAFYEGREGTVSVVETDSDEPTVEAGTNLMGSGKTLSLYVNGKIDASDNPSDMVTQSMLAHLPMQFLPAVRRALVVGMGSGVTAGALADYPIGQVDVVEISPEVVRAAREFFGHVNRGLHHRPNVAITVDDARHTLLRTPPDRAYDLIISEPSNAWLSGASNLLKPSRTHNHEPTTRPFPGSAF